ncbi:unnamed protein product [Phytophthora lilii]|uniref:Unnamed protein product n=1 Tax=Phytophthora lilii TaxID=2077276 RepID=A0A9W6TPJ8_9STRA|nr:unnamed protein product [Phytophthora lilii]
MRIGFFAFDLAACPEAFDVREDEPLRLCSLRQQQRQHQQHVISETKEVLSEDVSKPMPSAERCGTSSLADGHNPCNKKWDFAAAEKLQL